MLYVVFSYVATKKNSSYELFFLFTFNNILEENTVNLVDEMLTEEGDTTMHNDEDQEVFECAVHDNACFDFMF